MSKIVALSLYGFKLDSLKNDWDKVDKSLLHRDLFNSLQKGLEIEVRARNDKGFITDFQIKGVNCAATTKNFQPTPSVKNSMMYGQCVNLAFNHVSTNECGLNIIEAFDLADKIYEEYLKRC